MPRTFHPVPNTTKCEVRYTLDNQDVENVLWYWWPTANKPSATALAVMAQDIYGTIGNKIMQMMVTGSVMREVYCRNEDTEHADQATYAPSPPAGGTRTGTKLASQVGYSITKQSGRTGYGEHGGIRLSGFDSAEVTQNTVQSALFTLIANLIVSLAANRLGGTLQPVIAHVDAGTFSTILRWVATKVIVGSLDTRTPPRT